jgi:nucleoside-diphosphate-sugar epimerase
MSDTVLVTGASGFVGLNVVEALLGAGRSVVALSHDDLPATAAASFARLPGRLEAVRADILAPGLLGDLVRKHGVREAVHLAAITFGAQEDLRGSSRVLDVNAIGTLAMFEVAVAHRLRRVVYSSSTAVYGEAPLVEESLDEDTIPRPFTLYGITKLLGERMMRHFRDSHGLDCVAARFASVFGPWERDTGLRATLSPPWQLARLALRGEEARIHAQGMRDWVHGGDVARAVALLLGAARPRHEAYDVNIGETWHLRTMAEALAAEFPGFRFRVVEDEAESNISYFMPLGRRRAISANRNLAAEFGFRPEFPPATAARHYARWVREHPGIFGP